MGTYDQDYLTWLHRHMALECIQLNEQGDLARLPCHMPENIPRMYVARHHEKHHIYFRHDIPSVVRDILLARPAEELMSEYEEVSSLFQSAGFGGTGDIWRGKSYIYATDAIIDFQSDIQFFEDKDRCAILIDGDIATQCLSIRSDVYSAEAYVETHPDFRRRGLGKQVVARWAERVYKSGRLPFYSHHVDNTASKRLADSLGFVWYIDDVAYE